MSTPEFIAMFSALFLGLVGTVALVWVLYENTADKHDASVARFGDM